MDSILARRSIRKYVDKKISEDDINKMIKAGMNAPSARNMKTSEFVVIKDRSILDAIVDKNPHASMLKEANLAIAVCGKELSEFWHSDLAASTQNILIKATELGIGSCWIGIYPIDQKEEDMKEVLNVPSDVRVFSVISLGYPNEQKDMNNRFDEEKIHMNVW